MKHKAEYNIIIKKKSSAKYVIRINIYLQNFSLQPWLVWLSWLERRPITQGLQVWFPVRAHTWVVVSFPSLGESGRQLINVSLLHKCFSPFLSLKESNEKISLGKDEKKLLASVIWGIHVYVYTGLWYMFLLLVTSNKLETYYCPHIYIYGTVQKTFVPRSHKGIWGATLAHLGVAAEKKWSEIQFTLCIPHGSFCPWLAKNEYNQVIFWRKFFFLF